MTRQGATVLSGPNSSCKGFAQSKELGERRVGALSSFETPPFNANQ